MKYLLLLLLASIFTVNLYGADSCLKLGVKLLSKTATEIKIPVDKELYLQFDKSLKYRVDSFEMTSAQADLLYKGVTSFREDTGVDLIGPGIVTCYQTFSEEAFVNVNKMILAGTDAKSGDDAFLKMTRKAAELFHESSDAAKKRVCALLTPGSNCRIFSDRLLSKIKCD